RAQASAQPAKGHVLDRFHAGMLRVYRKALEFSLRHALLFALTPLALIVATIYLFTVVKTGLFPQQDTGLIWGRASAGGGGTSQGAQYQISLQGNDLASLQLWLPRLVTELKKNRQLRDVGSDIDEGGLRQNIVIDRDKAAQMGISVGAVDGALYDAFGQRRVSTIYSDINQYEVVVNALPSQTATPDSINRIYVKSSNGTMVPIT